MSQFQVATGPDNNDTSMPVSQHYSNKGNDGRDLSGGLESHS